MLRKRVFRLAIVHIWVVLSSKVVDLLMFSKGVSKLRNVQVVSVQDYKGVYLLVVRKAFSGCERSDMSSAILPEGRFADAQESCFQGVKSLTFSVRHLN